MGAIMEIEKHTCFDFQERNNMPNGQRLAIAVDSRTCDCCFGAGVSAGPGPGEVTLRSDYQLGDNPTCTNQRKDGIVHELMHALGVMHTQSRKDRDDYITVNYNNIENKGMGQYRICQECNNHTVRYDCGSIMHYGTGLFSNGRGPTMTAKNPNTCKLNWVGNLGQGASATDWQLLKIIANKVC